MDYGSNVCRLPPTRRRSYTSCVPSFLESRDTSIEAIVFIGNPSSRLFIQSEFGLFISLVTSIKHSNFGRTDDLPIEILQIRESAQF